VPQAVPVSVKAKAGAAAPDFAQTSRNLRDAAGAVAAGGLLTNQEWAPLAAALSLTGIAGDRLLVPAMEWLGNDPPDEDFQRPVWLKRSHLRPSPALSIDAPTVQHALDAFEDINVSTAALRAMLRAVEREEAATVAGDRAAADRRREEGRGFRIDAAVGLGQTASSYSMLAEDQKQLASRYGERPPQGRAGRPFSATVRRLLIDSRVPKSLASVPPPRPEWEGFSEVAQALAVAATDCRDLAALLERWQRPA
jgi:hypothetical protein